MSFGNPSALWALSALIPLVALLLWRARRRRLPVPSLLLWNRLPSRSPGPSRSRSLFFDTAVLPAVAFMALVLFALSQPALVLSGSRPRKLLILADLSARMGARSAGGADRWAGAASLCGEVLRALPGSWQIALRTVPEGALESPDFSLTRDEALDTIRSFAPTEAQGDVVELYRRSLAALPPGESVPILVLTDRVPAMLAGSPPRPVRVIAAGGQSNNVGIVSFSAGAEAGTVFAAVKNFSSTPREMMVTLNVDSAESQTQPLQLAPGERRSLVFRQRLAEARTVKLSLAPSDELAADDTVWAVREPEWKSRVAYAGEPDALIRKALEAAGAEVVDVPPATDTRSFALAVYNRAQMPAVTAPQVVLIRPPATQGGIRVGSELKDLVPLIALPNHPLMAGMSFDNVTIATAVAVKLPDRYSRLVEAGGQPLIASGGPPARATVVLAFRPSDSNWPLKASFPIFWVNVLAQARGGQPASAKLQYVHTGRPVHIRPLESPAVEIDGPGGSARLSPSADGFVSFVPLRVGFYSQSGAEGDRFAANLLDPAQSDTQGSAPPIDPVAVARELSAEPVGVAPRGLPLEPWLIVLAMGCLIVLWLMRRGR